VIPGFPTDTLAVQPIALHKDDARDGVNCTVSGRGLLGEIEKTSPRNLQVVFLQFIPYDERSSRYTCYRESNQPGMNFALSLSLSLSRADEAHAM